MLRRILLAALAGAVLLTGPLVAGAAATGSSTAGSSPVTSVPLPPMPSKQQWYSDVREATLGSFAYVDRRAAKGGKGLAVNLDIDNTSLASHYDAFAPIPRMVRFAQHARRAGVAILFNTGRLQSQLTEVTKTLRADGFDLAEVCGRSSTRESLAHSKQRCRQHFVDEGYRLIANIGNNDTDLVGGNYERGFKLPDYDRRLA